MSFLSERAALVGRLVPVLILISAPTGALASATRTRVAISPEPGTPDASPDTQISVLGVAPAQIAAIRVTGSTSGVHGGAFHAYSGRRGASFVLRRPLAQGERVSVVVGLRDSGPLRTNFTVARLGVIPPTLNLPLEQPAKLQHFASRPDLTPPKIAILRRSPAASSGDVFLTPLPSPVVHPGSSNAISIHPVGPGGPMIVDKRGRLVWFRQVQPPQVAANLRLQRYLGHQVLTWWQGTVTIAAFGAGEGVIADNSYRTVKTVKAGNGYPTDLHEFTITPSGDALFTVYSPVLVHVAGTPAGKLLPLLDALVQEVDIRTGLVVWEWHALGHIPLKDSYATPANSADYDAFHINSIEPETGGRILISARDTSAIYDVDRATGRIVWTLGGKASTFRLGSGARFYFQHDAHMVAPDVVSLFDDEAGPPQEAPSSRGLMLRLDMRRHRAVMVRSYRRPGNGTSAQSEGSAQPLPNGNVFVGFGSTRFFSEFSAGGSLLFDASLPVDDGSYRVFTDRWSARPSSSPTIAARRLSTGLVGIWASWNGVTQRLRWQVLGARAGGQLKPLRTDARSGFETRIAVMAGADTAFRVRALSASNGVLGSSRTVVVR